MNKYLITCLANMLAVILSVGALPLQASVISTDEEEHKSADSSQPAKVKIQPKMTLKASEFGFSVTDLNIAPKAVSSSILGFNDQGVVVLETVTPKPGRKTIFNLDNDGYRSDYGPGNSIDTYVVNEQGCATKIDSNILSSVIAINNKNIILGNIWINSINKGTFLLLDLQTNNIREVANFAIIDSPTGQPHYSLECLDFNDKSQIIGVAVKGLKDDNLGFLWDPEEGFTYFDKLIPIAINNQGMILGKQPVGGCPGYFSIVIANQKGEKLYEIDQENDATIFVSLMLNDSGQVAGIKGKMGSNDEYVTSGFLWEAESGYKYLSKFFPLAINNQGQMIVAINKKRESNNLALICQEKKFILPIITNNILTKCAINNNGQIVGIGDAANSFHPLLLTPLTAESEY